jgi:thioredoxin reductase (NADPH)
MAEPKITVYGAHWCPDCRRSKQFLGEHQIPYAWVDIEQDPAGEQTVLSKNAGRRILPTIVFDDGSFLVEPTNAQLAEKLGLRTKASRSHYQTVILGGGPAGLTAAFYLAREGIDTLVIERAAFGGQAAATEKLDNLPGFPESIRGGDFANRLRQQAQRFGVELLQAQDVAHLRSHDNYHCVDTISGDQYSAFSLLIATGSRYKRLNVPGESDYIGAGVHFCATCDGPFYKGKAVAVVGGGNSAAEESLHLTKFADKVTLLVRGPALKASPVIQESVAGDPKVEIRYHTEVTEFVGAESKLNGLHLHNNETGERSTLAADGAFIFIGLEPNVAFLEKTPIVRDDYGFLITGHDLVHDGARLPGYARREPAALETSVPGIFAAGDVRAASTKQVASAAGEGATAALLIREYLKSV